MTTVADKKAKTTTGPKAEFHDVLIVGAGLSGIDAAYRIHELNPDLDYALIERRERTGGTWDLFRYPGIRSDSDIFTFSLPFNPWTGKTSIGQGEDIRNYIWDTARKFGIDQKIQFQTHVKSANFDSTTDLWTVETISDGKPKTYQARFLFMCTGYYSYDEGYTPEFPGIENFGGQVVHPQFWPEDLDYKGKKVVVIGSGATAITLIPSMADDVEHITMLQRSPTYITSLPNKDPIALATRKVLPAGLAHNVTRWRWATQTLGSYLFMRKSPKAGRALIRRMTKAMLPADYPVDVHFKPKYDPWDQRLCVVPNGDLFKAIRNGQAEVVTDTVDHVTATGIKLASGRELEADIIITATGLQMQALGGTDIAVDGSAVKISDHYLYRGYMLDGVPNMAWTIGYINASWTLKADITSQHVARLLKHMGDNGYTHAEADLAGEVLAEKPAMDLSSGYVQRAADQLPKSSSTMPWMVRHNFLLDYYDFRRASVTQSMKFGTVADAKEKVAG